MDAKVPTYNLQSLSKATLKKKTAKTFYIFSEMDTVRVGNKPTRLAHRWVKMSRAGPWPWFVDNWGLDETTPDFVSSLRDVFEPLARGSYLPNT